MDAVTFDAVTKIFRQRRGLFARPPAAREDIKTALRDVTFSVPAGKVLVLLGPNGSGKTTLLKLVSTMLLPDSGRVLVQGADTLRHPDRARRCMGMAVASERSFFPRLSVWENLEFFATLDDVPRELRRERVAHVLQTAGLFEVTNNQVMTFSSGMYQRLGTARALLKKPSVLLLDEPTRSLDPGSLPHFWQLVRDLACSGCTVLLATHNFDEALAVGDCIAVLREGEIADFWNLPQVASYDELQGRYFRSTGEHDGDLRTRCIS